MEFFLVLIVLPIFVCIVLTIFILFFVRQGAKRLIRNEEWRGPIVFLLSMIIIAGAVYAIKQEWIFPRIGSWN